MAVDALNAGGQVDFNYKVIIDPSFENNTTLMNVYNQFGGLPTFQSYLQNFEGTFSVAHLILAASSALADNVNALTTPPNTSNLIEITFNTNNLNRPPLDIARTMIHEMIHANIFRYMLIASEIGALEPENGMTQEQQTNYIKNLQNNFSGIYDYYYDRELPNWQHEMMAQHYRDIIIQALIEFDNSHSSELYEALAWVGLKGTVAWNNLSPQQQANYNQIAQNFVNGD